jgi:nitrate reductase NapE component
MDHADKQALAQLTAAALRWLAALLVAALYLVPLAAILGVAAGLAVWAFRLVAG